MHGIGGVGAGHPYLRQPRPLSNVVAMGGGSGLPVVLAGLRRSLPTDCRITAVVTAADDGGSSGVLREQYDVLPPGDIRNCLLALSRVGPEVSAALQYRFDGVDEVGHPVGNLLLAALEMVTPDELTAIRLAALLLGVQDVILPSTTNRVHLVAELADGREIRGESKIPRSAAAITRLRVDPPDARAAHDVVHALRTADAVILGPGSLYTSVLASVVVPGILDALLATHAVRIFVCNLTTEPGETDGYGVDAHVAALAAHGLGAEALDYVVVNATPIPTKALARGGADGASSVTADFTPAARPQVVSADLLDDCLVVQHAADKLGPLLARLLTDHVASPEHESPCVALEAGADPWR
jgi:uncharacterized cofD-like protein